MTLQIIESPFCTCLQAGPICKGSTPFTFQSRGTPVLEIQIHFQATVTNLPTKRAVINKVISPAISIFYCLIYRLLLLIKQRRHSSAKHTSIGVETGNGRFKWRLLVQVQEPKLLGPLQCGRSELRVKRTFRVLNPRDDLGLVTRFLHISIYYPCSRMEALIRKDPGHWGLGSL